MIKPEWGTKRTCPQTGERFYDLGKDNPVTSPSGFQWHPEPVLKSKQPMPFDAPKKEVVVKDDEAPDGDLNEDLDIDEEEEAPVDDDTDIGGDDDLGVATRDADDEH